MTAPRFASAASAHPDPRVAVGEVVGAVLDAIGPEPALAFLAVSTAHLDALEEIVSVVRRLLAPRTLMGASAVAVIGGASELDDREGIALWAGSAEVVEAMHLTVEEEPEGWRVEGLDPSLAGDATLLLVADPYSFPAEAVIAAMAERAPSLVICGGFASGARSPNDARLVLDDAIHRRGAVGVLVRRATAAVSQGCRPVGEPLIATRVDDNVVFELGGRTPYERLQQTFAGASEADRVLIQRGLQIGLVIDERKTEFDRGDFLVRGLLAIDEQSGAIAVNEHVELGTTLQFQVRDAASAHDDLDHALVGRAGAAALVFSCVGRGRRFFGVPDHDASAVAAVTGPAVGGFFCDGEIGPVGRRNHLHTYTASIVLFA